MTYTIYYNRLDGFQNVTITCNRTYELERIKSFYWVIDCDDFVYKSPFHNNWSDQVWKRAKKMYKEQVKHVIQP